MRVIRAEVLGMCFGVRDALKIIDRVAEPNLVTIHGELVHNELVLEQLDRRGFHRAAETARDEPCATPAVLITAHGVSDVERRRLEQAGKRLIDTTCPLVTRVHRAAQSLQAEGFHVLVIGKRGHVEVRGVVEDLEHHDVIENVEQVRVYSQDRLGVICQSTAPAHTVSAIRSEIERRNPRAEIRFIDTVCHPTKDHQRALEELIDQVEAMVVVGGGNSNNTKELAATCRRRGLPAFHVQSAADLDPAWFDEFEMIGLTAGTSTLDSTIDEVHRALLALESRVEEPAASR
jgi:4-hydroxy-3-methylbut-2-en-1-yl diphosphate reductase